MTVEKTAFAVVWTACTANMVADGIKLAKRIHAKKTSK